MGKKLAVCFLIDRYFMCIELLIHANFLTVYEAEFCYCFAFTAVTL